MAEGSPGNTPDSQHRTANAHRICQEFQQQLRAGKKPDLRSCLNRCEPKDRDQAATWLLAIEVRSRIAAGQQPRCEEYLATYPDFANVVQHLFNSLGRSSDASSFSAGNQAEDTTIIQQADSETDSAYGRSDRRFLETEIGRVDHEESWSSDDDLLRIKQFAAYDIIRPLGRGGMGIVMLAEDRLLRRKVALKIMRAELSSMPEFKERFYREARAMASVDSPHVMPLFQFGEDEGMLYICMPYVPGETLADRLKRSPRMKPSQVIDLMLQLAEGLEAAHRVGLIHRDIKPSNVWLASDADDRDRDSFSRALLIDFGLVRVDNHSVALTGSSDLLGTPGYLAPEQAQRGRVDARSDLFSLGIVAYQTLCGYNPFVRDTAALTIHAIMHANPRPVRLVQESVPPAVSELVMTLLSKKPDDRPASAADLRSRLRGVRIRLREETPAPEALQHSHRTTNSTGYSEGGWEIDFGTISEHSLHIFIGTFVVMMAMGFFWYSQYWNSPQETFLQPDNSQLVAARAGEAVAPTPDADSAQSPGEKRTDESVPTKNIAIIANDAAIPVDPGTGGSMDGTAGRPAHHLSNGASVAITDNSVTLDGNFQDRQTPIDGQIIDVQPADNCRLLVLKIEHEPALTIYDAVEGKLLRKLLLPTPEFVYSAGGEAVVVYFPEFHELQRWNLKTYEREMLKETTDQITNLAMHPNNSRLTLVRSLSQDKNPRVLLSFLDVQTLEPAKSNGETIRIEPVRSSVEDTVHYRMNQDFSMVTEWSTRYSPSGLQVYMRLEDGSFRGISEHTSTGFLIPTEQGFVFTQSGSILSSEAIRFRNTSGQIESPPFPNTLLFPEFEGEYFVASKPGEELALFHRGSSEVVCRLGVFPGDDREPARPAENGWYKSALSPARRILLVLDSDALLLLPPSNDAIIRRPIDFETILGQAGSPYLLVLSATSIKLAGGESLEHSLRCVSDSVPLTFEVVEGPQGLTVDEQGKITWQAPTGIVGRVPVSVEIKNRSGQGTLHRLMIKLGGNRE